MINNLVDELIKKGSHIDKEYLINSTLSLGSNYKEKLSLKLKEITNNYMNNPLDSIDNVNVCIKVGDSELTCYSTTIDSLYDIASVTKLFAVKLIYELTKEKLIDVNKTIYELDNRYVNLKEYKLIDLLNMHGKIETDGRLSASIDNDDLRKRLKTTRVIDPDFDGYTDVGYTLLSDILDNLIEGENTKSLMQKYVLDKHSLTNTRYLPDGIVYGNAGTIPNDTKTMIMGGVNLAAGLFTNMIDFKKLATLIKNYEFFDLEFLEFVKKYKFYDVKNRERTIGGIYLQSDNEYSFASKELSHNTLAHQGFTGAMICVDFDNDISILVLLDAFKNTTKKMECFSENFYKYQDELVIIALQFYLCQQMYNFV